jgi:hypothetical protein
MGVRWYSNLEEGESFMTHARTLRTAFLLLVLSLVLTALAATGCGSKQSTGSGNVPTPQGQTAKQALPAAQSALATTAPDAKLLLVQTAQAVTPTSTPVWAYLFGSPKSGTLYVVRVANGAAMPPAEYGKASEIGTFDWGKVPSTDQWKVDSTEAYQKAYTASGAKSAPPQWVMGFITYVPNTEETQTATPFVWSVQFDPGTSGATPNIIDVNATTGATKVEATSQ